MVFGISGKINSGKDTVGKIIQILTDSPHFNDEGVKGFLKRQLLSPKFKNKKFADKLKDNLCSLIGCTRDKLEDREFKEKELSEEWWYWYMKLDGGYGTIMLDYLTTTKEQLSMYEGLVLVKPTPRLLLQLLGTEAGRDIIHPNLWVNALLSEYQETEDYVGGSGHTSYPTFSYPNWVITDMRFPNEMEAVKKRGGITIRVNRPIKLKQYNWDKKCPCCSKKEDYIGTPQEGSSYWVYNYVCNDCTSTWDVFRGDKMGGQFDSISNVRNKYKEHPSETALDDANFDYIIDNNGTIEELIQKVRIILQREKIIN